MKKNITNKKNRAGLLITAAALTLTAVFAAGTVSAGAVSINKATGYSQSVTSAKETLAMSIAKRVYAGHNLQQADYSEDVILVETVRPPTASTGLAPATSRITSSAATTTFPSISMILSSSARSRACPTSPSTTTRATIRVSRRRCASPLTINSTPQVFPIENKTYQKRSCPVIVRSAPLFWLV